MTRFYAVLAQVEGVVDVAYATSDIDDAHEVFAAATRHEDEVKSKRSWSPAQITLINCVDNGAQFLARLEES